MAKTREDQLYIALQKSAGALRLIADWLGVNDKVIKFTGGYADLGSMTVSQIIDEANEALEEK